VPREKERTRVTQRKRYVQLLPAGVNENLQNTIIICFYLFKPDRLLFGTPNLTLNICFHLPYTRKHLFDVHMNIEHVEESPNFLKSVTGAKQKEKLL
jgi:hypothetical protein